MFRIAICDDTQSCVAELAALLKKLSDEIQLEVSVDVCRSLKALGELVEKHTYQIIVLEVTVGGQSSIEYMRGLRAEGFEGDIVFFTSDASLALEAYCIYPTGYIIKPSNRKKIREVFCHIVEKYERKPSIALRNASGGKDNVNIDDIMYIEVFRTELDVHCKNGILICSGSLVETYGVLPPRQFYRSHRSFIVNLKHVVQIGRYQFTMANGDKVTIAKNRYTEAKRAFDEFVVG